MSSPQLLWLCKIIKWREVVLAGGVRRAAGGPASFYFLGYGNRVHWSLVSLAPFSSFCIGTGQFLGAACSLTSVVLLLCHACRL
jgi:hypothetical protein